MKRVIPLVSTVPCIRNSGIQLCVTSALETTFFRFANVVCTVLIVGIYSESFN